MRVCQDISFVTVDLFISMILVGPWLWKEEKYKEEKVKIELHGIHSNYYWVKVRKRA
jgi:hypothetical protein